MVIAFQIKIKTNNEKRPKFEKNLAGFSLFEKVGHFQQRPNNFLVPEWKVILFLSG